MKKLKIVFLLSALTMSLSCYAIRDKLSATPEIQRGLPTVDLPNHIGNASPDPYMRDEKAVVVSMTNANTFYVGYFQLPSDELSYKISKLLTENPSGQNLVYLRAGALIDFREVAKSLDAIRKTDTENVALAGYKTGGSTEADLGFLKVKIPAEPKAEDDALAYANRQFAEMKKDRKIFFGSTDAKGMVKLDKTETKEDETGGKISQIFGAKSDKTFYVKPSRSSRYVDVVRLIDAAIGAGATVYLQIDDLSEN